jgi:hypothetical protein
MRESRWRMWLSTSAVVLTFVLATIWCTYPQINVLNSVPPHNDPLFSMWRLAWVAHQLQTAPAQMFDANILYPARGTLLYSDAFLLLGLFATPLIWSGLPPVVAYNVLILVSFLFAGLGAFVFLRHLTGSTLAGLIGGLIYAFSAFRFGHYMHQELLWNGWIPLTLWGLHRTIDTGGWRPALLTALCLVAQMYSSIYYGIFLATFIAIVSVFLLALRVLDWRSAAFRRLLAAGALSAVLIAPYMYVYAKSAEVVGERQESETAFFSAAPIDYLSSPRVNRLWGWTSTTLTTREGDETHLFPGACALVLAAIGLWPPISRVRVAYAAALLIAIDLSLGFNGYSYRLLFDLSQVFRGLRATARFAAFVQLTIALFAADGFTRLLVRALPRRAMTALLVAGVSGILIAEYSNRPLPLVRMATRPSTLSLWLRQQPPAAVLLELPLPRLDALPGRDPHYQFESTFHWHPLVNGYTSFVPPRYAHFLDWMFTFPDDRSIGALRASGADLIIVHPQWFDKQRSPQDTVAWLQHQPDFRFEGAFADHGGSVLVFRRVRSAS